MDKPVSGSPRCLHSGVRQFLRARGVPPSDLPPDMLRELNRLLAEPETAAASATDEASVSAQAARKEHRHDMLSFEMYLAAWIAREGMCDRPKPRRVKKKRTRPNS